MLGATVVVNRDTIGHIEVVRTGSCECGKHTYRYRIYKDGAVQQERHGVASSSRLPVRVVAQSPRGRHHHIGCLHTTLECA
jgi:hypothetical protein